MTRPWRALSRWAVFFSLTFYGLLLLIPGAGAQAPIPSPEDYFGHRMGADQKLVSYDEFVPYLKLLAEHSDRVELEEVGTTTQGRPLYMLFISSPQNLAEKERYRRISQQLNDPRGLTETQIETLTREGKVILLVTLNIHSSEIAASQMGLRWAYDLVVGTDPDRIRDLDDVIVLLVPSVNPDGQVMITEWYRDYVGTKFEGGFMPWLYHPYAGHDNNRDWFMLNLTETLAVNRLAYHEWFPQILVDEHQMGPTGPRAFVPPYADPVTEHVHPLIHRGSMLIGANMAMDLEQAGKSGVIYAYSFDAYWPGGTRSTPWWKNTVGVLTEIASAGVASPIYIDPGELAGGRKGLPDYRAQVNFPNPWPGGWWRQQDIVDYELIITDSALHTSAVHRQDFLRNRALMAMDAVTKGETEAPYGYVVPSNQHDPGTAAKLVDLIRENGLEVYRVTSTGKAGIQLVPKDSYYIPTAQPFRAFLVEMMEPQTYPRIRVGPHTEEVHEPYDVTSWTLPYLMGVDTFGLNSPLESGALEPVDETAWDAPNIIEGTGAYWAMSPAFNDAYAAVMRLLSADQRVYQARDAFDWKGGSWPAGTFLVSAEREELVKAVDGLCVEARSVSVPITASEATAGGRQLADIPGGARLRTLRAPRVGIYQSWLASMDEGWTRYVLDTFDIPYTVLHDDDIRAGSLGRTLDVIVLPDMTRQELVHGKPSVPRGRYRKSRPQPYDGGLGTHGVAALSRFVDEGGVLVAMGDACDLAIDELNIPVENATASLTKKQFSTPGTMLRVSVNTQHPLGYGMPPQALVYHNTDPVLVTLVPGAEARRAVVARFAPAEDVVASGWAEGVKHLGRRAAAVETAVGDGRVVLLAFRPQHRAQTQGTYRFLFNAILGAAVE